MLGSDDKSYNNSTPTPRTSNYSSLQEAYHDHENYIWHVCKEGLKLIYEEADNFEGPTYAWEYQGKFIVKGTSNGLLFRCEYVKSDNERWMNLENVEFESF